MGRKSVPIWMWLGSGAALVLVAVVAVLMMGGGDDPGGQDTAQAQRPQPREPQGPPLNTQPLMPSLTRLDDASRPTSQRPGAAPVVVESPEDIYKLAKSSVVKIDVFSDNWNPRSGLGSGFIIDTQQRLIVTNYHVICEAAKADILFDDGTRFGIEGYVLVEPRSDLAILKANGLPPYAQALELAPSADPNPGSQVYAIGHPHDYKLTMRSGLISSVADTTELPEDAQFFLESEGTDRSDNRWIQHEAEIYGGNSGGPLLNKHGQVLGVNTWKDESINGYFALHSKILSQLLKRPTGSVEPLVRYQKRETRTANRVVRQFDMNVLRGLFNRLELSEWMPESEEDYEAFSMLAVALTVMGAANFDSDDPRGQAWQAQLDEFFKKLDAVEWTGNVERWESLNRWTHEVFDEPTTGQGFFVVAQLSRVSKRRDGLAMGATARIAGTQRFFEIQLLEPTSDVEENGIYLVPGVIAAHGRGRPNSPLVVAAKLIPARGHPPDWQP